MRPSHASDVLADGQPSYSDAATATSSRGPKQQQQQQEEEGGEEQQQPQQQQQPLQHLVVIRHGRRLDSVDPNSRLKTKQPWDPPLAPHWDQECAAKAPQLQGLSFGLVLVSPFTRCAQTAAGLVPHLNLDPDCKIFFHKGLSEFFIPGYLFFPCPPGCAQQLRFWRWRAQRNCVLPEFANMGGVAVEKKVLGSWPELPETQAKAQARFEGVMQEALGAAAGRKNVLIVSHAGAVEHSVCRMRPLSMLQGVAFLGHTVTSRRHLEGGSTEGAWRLQDPEPGSGVQIKAVQRKTPR